MWQSLAIIVSAAMLMSPLYAEEMHYQSETGGDRLTISQTPDGKHWATLIISDRHTASFAHNELILLQIDEQTPISLEHDNLSCGSPAKADQTVFYDFSESASASLATANPQPLPKGFQQVRQRDVFSSIMADRRAETVDFLLSDASLSLQQLSFVKTVKFRFVTDDGQCRQAIFRLN
ncbi:hypothetical protein [Methylophaga nitratireducenticrescens]|jgi:hypothetical protein|uniref:Uncharacterized protein n=1 Tax=Methylophaga nitratireducenticrescens TaxID=754476 RepID=I1XF04_METNJ|nr:hypothetical protein [Methylophaga nitratireducenticrescens]